MFGFRFVSVLLFVILKDSLAIPPTPCPELFNYYKNDKEVFGGIRIQNDLSGVYMLVVNVTVPALFTDVPLRLQRLTSESVIKNGGALEYYVGFPQSDIPYLTSITLNDRVLCRGPNPNPTSKGITMLSVYNYFKTVIKKEKPQINNITALETGDNLLSHFFKPPTDVPIEIPAITSQAAQQNSFLYITSPISITPPFIERTTIAYTNNKEQQMFEECGVAEDYKPLIVHGNPTRSGEYPWLVALFYQDEKTNYNFKCAGNLITNKHVVTAAHCLEYRGTRIVEKEQIVLVFGNHDISMWARKSQLRDVKSIYVHPDFYIPGDADIAILQSAEEVPFNHKIKPICLWKEDDRLEKIVAKKGTVVGWGKDELDRQFVNEPKQIEMPVVTQEDCLRSDDRFLRITSNRTFCAGDRSGAAPCSGDSGGGFLIRDGGKWYLRGIVSVALVDSKKQSCDTYNYIVFSDVPKYNDWIQKVLRRTM